jgi:hypothetical protein
MSPKKIAYLILAHTDPEHLHRLVKALDCHADFYVHIDKKSSIGDFLFLKNICNVFLTKQRVSVTWAGISMVDAICNLIVAALANKKSYSHFVLISGSDYPIKPAEFIVEFLNNNDKCEFIKYIDMRESPEHYLKQVYRKWFVEPIYSGKMKPVGASSGGMFNNYAIVQGVDHVVPVDIYLPGCPPRPEMLMDAIIKLHEQIATAPLGANRVAAAAEAEQAALAATPTGQMKGLLR